MKYFFLLVVAALSESAFLPIHLVLALLLAKLFLTNDEFNFYLCLLIGIILGFLTMVNMGFWAVVFLLIMQVIKLFKRSQFSQRLFVVCLFAMGILIGVRYLELRLFGVRFEWWKNVVEIVVFLLAYLLMNMFGSYLPKPRKGFRL